MIRFYCIGISILLIAVLANGIVIKLGIKSWYNFLELMSTYGFSAFKNISLIDYFWLFIGYPFVLAFGYWIGDKIHQLIFTT